MFLSRRVKRSATAPVASGSVKRKKLATSPPIMLRSGLIVRHPLIKEAATMQVEALATFELSQDSEASQSVAATKTPPPRRAEAPVIGASNPGCCSQTSTMPSWSPRSQTSTLPPWSPRSQTSTLPPWSPRSQTSTLPPWSPRSQTSTLPPWSPRSISTPAPPRTPEAKPQPPSQSTTETDYPGTPPSQSTTVTETLFTSPTHSMKEADSFSTPRPPPRSRLSEANLAKHMRINTPRTPDGEVPMWFEEACESDGYTSEDLKLIEGLRPSSLRANSLPEAASPDRASDHDSTPGAERLPTGVGDLGDWVAEAWPGDVKQIREQYNPHGWRFHPVSVGSRRGAGCGCETRCSASTCFNASESRFCTDRNCVFGGVCGNALNENGSLAIARNSKTGMRGLVAMSFIPAGEVIGQYLGRLELLGAPSKSGPANDGYQMRLKTKTTGNKHVGIDALAEGGVLRLMNHSCNPATKFHEVQTGDRLTVVAVTVRPIAAGEEVTVSYGNKLWFVCRCGWIGCQHRDIQHLPDVHYAQSQKA